MTSEELREDRPTSSAMRRLWQGYKESHPLGFNSTKTFYTIDWRAQHGLQFVGLRLMHHRAVAQGVPFPADLPPTIGRVSTAIDATLTAYWEALRDGRSIQSATANLIRQTYCHLSAHNEVVTGGFQPFLPVHDGIRTVDTM